MKKFILNNFNLSPEELVHIDEVINRIKREDHGVISEYELHDLVDHHLYEILQCQ
jgi:hypothetical protein